MRFKGTITALITPFKHGELDEEGLRAHIKAQIDSGVDGIVALGSTGESSTLSEEEQERVIAIAVHAAKGKIPVIIGTGDSCTKKAIEKTQKAKKLGADAALVIAPYCTKPTQEGLYLHYKAISSSVAFPLIVYNIMSRTGVNIETATLQRIAKLPHVIGVKEASSNLAQVIDILHSIKDFTLLSGDDILTLPMIALGAHGVISVVSNLIPKHLCDLVNVALKGDFEKARTLHYELLPLFKAAFLETNPIPIKEAMTILKMPSGGCRLPLCEMSQQNRKILNDVIIKMGLL